MRDYLLYVKEFILLLIYCVFVAFSLIFIIRISFWGFHFFRGGNFEFGMDELRNSIVAGVIAGSFSAVGACLLSIMDKRHGDENKR